MAAAQEIGIRIGLQGAREVDEGLTRIRGGMDRMGSAATTLRNAMGGLAGAFAGVVSVREFVQAADSITELQNRLKLATGGAQQAAQAYSALYDIAQRSRTGFVELGQTFSTISTAASALGVSQDRLLRVTEAIGNAVTISGSSAQAAQAALMQLGQGLASGTLRGEELNSVMEQTPRLAQALADGLGVSRGELRKLGEQGAITAEQVIKALESQADMLSGEVKNATLTVGQAMTQLQNSVVRLVGDADKASGATSMLASSIGAVADQLDALRQNSAAMDVLRVAGQAVYVLFTDVAFVMASVGREIGGIAAQAAAVARLDFRGAASIRDAMLSDAQLARANLDARQARILAPQAEPVAQAVTGAGGGRGAINPETVGAVTAAARRNAEAANALLQKLDGVPTGYLKDMEELIRLYEAGAISADAYQKALGTMQAQILKNEKTGKPARADAAAAARLAKEQAQAEEKALQLLLQVRQNAANARNAEANEIDAYMRKQEQAAEQALASVNDRITALQAEESAVTLATSLNISLAEAIERVAIERLREKQTGFAEGSEGWQAIEREIAARQKLLGLITTKTQREDEARGWADMWQSVDRTAHDVFVNVLQGGQDAFERLGNTLKATVLDVLYQLTVRKWIINIGTNVFGAGFGAAASAATGGGAGGALSALGSIGSGYSFLSGLGGAFGGGLAGGFGGLMGSLGLSATGSTLGGAISAGGIAMGSGNILGGLGTITGALGPIALGIALLSSLIKKSTPHMGAGVTYSAADGLVRGADQYSQANYGFGAAGEYNSAAESTVSAVARGIATALDSTARTFGRQAGFEISTAFADDKSKDGAWGQLAIRRNGETILDWRDTQTSRWAPREFSDGEAGLQEYQTAVAQSMREALDKMDLPGWAGDMLDALGESPSIENLGATLDQINAGQAALEQLGDSIVGFAALSGDALDALVKASGGVEALVNSAGFFFQNFYSEAERVDIASRQVSEAMQELGLAMPTTDAQFRALVETYMAMGEAGAETLAALLNLAPAFASVTESVEELSRAAREQAQRAAEDAARQAEAVAREREGLESRLYALMGNTVRLRERELAALDASNRGLLEQIFALEDADSAISSAYSALERAAAADKERLSGALDSARTLELSIKDVFALLRDEVRSLRGGTVAGSTMQASQARELIAGVLAGGALPTVSIVSEAVKALQAELDGTAYASKGDRDRATLRLASQLEDLQRFVQPQLSAAEQQVVLLEEQLVSIDQQLELAQQQIDAVHGVDTSVQSVASAVEALGEALARYATLRGGSVSGGPGGTGGPSVGYYGGGTGGVGSRPIGYTPSIGRPDYGAQEALASPEKFNDWFHGLRYNAQLGQGYEVPDWLRATGLSIGGNAGEDFDFQMYLFFKNNPQLAEDYQRIMTGGMSQFSTDGSGLIKSDLDAMPADIAAYYRANPAELLATEGQGLDPVLAYKSYFEGPQSIGITDPRTTSVTDYLRRNRWTENGIVANDNPVDYANSPFAGGYLLSRWDTTTGNIVDLDGRIYTPTGQFLGVASEDQMRQIYGDAAIDTQGGSDRYRDTTASRLYWEQVEVYGNSTHESFYSGLRTNIEQLIAAGWSAQDLVDGMYEYGMSLQDAAIAFGITPEEVAANLRAAGATNIPGFAAGGYYAGGLALVGEDGPELINFSQPGQVYTAPQTQSLLGGGEATARELRALREEQRAQSREMVKLQQRVAKVLERWDGAGIPEERVVA